MIHLRSALAVARKDALDILLDKAKLGVLISPIVLALLWLLLSRLLVSHPTTLLIYNPGQSPLEHVVSSAFSSTQITQASSAADVSAAFEPKGAMKTTPYEVGLVIPADFEQSLRTGEHPQISLYLNGSNISNQQKTLLQAAITNYARAVAAPTPPISLVTATINPATTNAAPLTLGKFYSLMAFSLSFVVGITLMPALLIEEKEKKTLRMLMVSPASFGDVLIGKVLVVFVYQVALSLTVLALFGAFSSSNAPLLLLYVLCGVVLAMSVGLLLGIMVDTAAASGGLVAAADFAFIIPGIFVPLVPYLNSSAITQLIKILPTYYVAEGVSNALQGQGSFSSNVIDVGVTLGCALVIFVGTVWLLRRQAQVAAVI